MCSRFSRSSAIAPPEPKDSGYGTTPPEEGLTLEPHSGGTAVTLLPDGKPSGENTTPPEEGYPRSPVHGALLPSRGLQAPAAEQVPYISGEP